MAIFKRLKINFFSGKDDALDKAVILEKTLMNLGVVSSSRSGGITQFHLATKLTADEVKRNIAELKLDGAVTVGEEDDEEMEPA